MTPRPHAGSIRHGRVRWLVRAIALTFAFRGGVAAAQSDARERLATRGAGGGWWPRGRHRLCRPPAARADACRRNGDAPRFHATPGRGPTGHERYGVHALRTRGRRMGCALLRHNDVSGNHAGGSIGGFLDVLDGNGFDPLVIAVMYKPNGRPAVDNFPGVTRTNRYEGLPFSFRLFASSSSISSSENGFSAISRSHTSAIARLRFDAGGMSLRARKRVISWTRSWVRINTGCALGSV